MYYHTERLPIFDVDLGVFGYELFYLYSPFDFKGGIDGDWTAS